MKKLLLLLGFAALCLTTANAQTSTAGNTPGISPGAQAVTPNVPFATPSGLPGSAVNNGLPAGPVSPGLPGFTNVLGPFFTNQLGSNMVGNLSPLLLNLQASLAQALPALAAFNNNFDVVGNGGFSSGTNGGSASTSPVTTPTTPAGGNNLSTLNSTSLGTSFATAAGQNLSTIVGGAPRTTTTTGPNGTTTTATTTTSSGLPGTLSSTGSSAAMSGLFGTNAVGFANSQDAFRALIVLQADVERMLPLVAALNGVAPGAVVGGGIGATNGVSGFPFTTGTSATTTTRQTGVNSLSPTGR